MKMLIGMSTSSNSNLSELGIVLILLAAVVGFNLLYSVFLKNKVKSETYLLLNSFLLVIAAGTLLFQSGVLIDRFGISGDGWSSLVFLLVFILGVIHLFVHEHQAKRKRQRQETN
ncbi:hypothetical protein [Marinilactibacillus sp. Marseille-P9653]|uniref:hypothetical protein n=1 Tax=Marinilactibacillus sp. Marseille-P9653 TaxID=2866583 RepID=UPI001CE4A53E|nr:hypothetical protein [Marinilactibacillus sp. Marseille-P9653]